MSVYMLVNTADLRDKDRHFINEDTAEEAVKKAHKLLEGKDKQQYDMWKEVKTWDKEVR